jgi:hypothetical protein
MKADENKLYIKVVDVDEIYNFLVDDFFIWNHLQSQNSVWSAQILKFNFFELYKRLQMEKRSKLKL